MENKSNQTLSTLEPSTYCGQLHNFVRRTDLPTSAILLPVLKTLEEQLLERALLRRKFSASFTPLWFLAETECNVFLWRSGYSLSDRDNFEFWVDVPALVEKRFRQLNFSDLENPLVNSLWGIASAGSETFAEERDYLENFVQLAARIAPHAHALSHIGSLLLHEESSGKSERVVLLPQSASSKTKSGNRTTQGPIVSHKE